jgi:L-Ala-D/L-Glu epimerase
VLQWSIEEKALKLRYNWKISRNESTEKCNFFVRVTDGRFTGVGEVAPNVRYGESPELIRKQFDDFIHNQFDAKESGPGFNNLSVCNSLRFGIESAFVHFEADKSGKKVFEYLNLRQPGPVATSYTIPIMEPGKVKEFIDDLDLGRFGTLKLKVNAENAVDLTKELARQYEGIIVADANEAFRDPDSVMNFFESVRKINFGFLEQPFSSGLIDEGIYLKKISPYEIIADESVTDDPDLDLIARQFHGANMKLMKAGGYYNGIRILKEVKKLGLKTMIGCMVETSLGISSALNLASLCDYADLDGCFIIERDPFNLVKEKTGKLFLSY